MSYLKISIVNLINTYILFIILMNNIPHTCDKEVTKRTVQPVQVQRPSALTWARPARLDGRRAYKIQTQFGQRGPPG